MFPLRSIDADQKASRKTFLQYFLGQRLCRMPQIQNAPGAVRRRHPSVGFADEPYGAGNELGVVPRKPAFSIEDVVFHTHPDMPAQRQRGEKDREVAGSDAERGPDRVSRQQTLEIDQIFNGPADAAGGAEHELEIPGAAKYALLHVVGGVVDHARIKDLDLRSHAELDHQMAKLFEKRRMIDEQGLVHPVHSTGIIRCEFGP